MRRILVSLIFLAIINHSYSQVQQSWAVSHIAQLDDQVVDANGNTYHATTTYSNEFDVAATLIIKHNKNGTELWRRFLPAMKVARALTIDALGNVYVTGAYSSTYWIGVIISLGNDPYEQNVRINTVKLNSSGEVMWSDIYGDDSAPLYGFPNDIVVDEFGNPYITGVLFSALEAPEDSATANMVTIKYNGPTGDRVWVKSYNGSTPGTGYDEGKAMAIDAFGFIYITGPSQLNGELDIATIKYTSAGDEAWIQRYSSALPGFKDDYTIRGGIKLDIAGNVIVSGISKADDNVQSGGIAGKTLVIKYLFTGAQYWVREKNSPFSPGALIITDNTNSIFASSDGETRKYSPAGDLLWTIPYGASDFAIDGNNNLYSVRSCLSFDNSCGQYYGFTTRKFDGSNGALKWEKTYSLFSNWGEFIGIDADKNIYTSGSEWWNIPRSGSSYATVRYSQCEIVCPSNISVNADPGKCDAVVTFADVTTTGDCGATLTYSHASGATFPVGETTVTVTSDETGASCSFTITVVDNEKPVITFCPSNKTVDMNAGVCYATVDPGAATATDNCSVTVTGERSDGAALNANYPGGITTITWTATDPSGNTATCSQTITVIDNQPPVVSGETASTYILSPPNHTMRDVAIDYIISDNCTHVDTTIVVSSNEPVNGTGDGDTDPDWIVVDKKNLKLRAERSANGSGRIYTITITATDGSGNATVKTIEVKVPHNIKKPNSGQPFKVGSTVSFEGEFWDKTGNKHTAKWLIDGSTTAKATVTEPAGNKNGKVTGSYKFTAPGVYKLQMNVTDQDGVTHYASTAGDLEAIVVIYDPNGGHAYGGGYFNSPAGALKSNPSATGKANYGFAMNYFKNSTNPKGETQFEFKVGEFEFNALNFDYLVINSAMAQFKGTGKIIGGQSGVGFTMTVVDGQLDGTGVDKIRMKIYNKNNGTIIYDNQPGASDAALPTQAVGANSTIVISSPGTSLSARGTAAVVEQEQATSFDVIAYPNPSNENFKLKISTPNQKERVLLKVYDVSGRLVETKTNINPNSIIQLGDKYRTGVYMIRVIQGKQHKEIKLVKF